MKKIGSPQRVADRCELASSGHRFMALTLFLPRNDSCKGHDAVSEKKVEIFALRLAQRERANVGTSGRLERERRIEKAEREDDTMAGATRRNDEDWAKRRRGERG